MSDASTPFAARHPADRAFFLAFAAVSIIAVAGGFLPRLETIFTGERPWPPLAVHIHAVLFYGWIGLLTAQVLLVRGGNVGLHKRLGGAGLVLAAGMIGVGGWMALTMAGWHLERGSDGALRFLPVPLMDLAIFGALITWAALRRRDSPTHKRLMVLATTQLLGAGFGRMDLYAMPATPWLPQVEMFVNLYGMLWLILALAIGFDVATRGRPHRVWWVAVPLVVAAQFAAATLLVWPGWRSFAAGVLGLG
ncbi:MAG: hypothetical protein KJ676_08625 [Alphaproteobacteria bacterium]|nr:hypothetical protein [Alphaproteobacteria bacterium]MBU1525411.1 hypothetical protein [Alphaproteobacteria bacterium]MBU2117021.1 hypothetical protein [Alphaproteobacteria bacterium]MBU2351108.1 hypothetical protein [Alphaproteobacteria bacterium]MBU2382701.1 hypothetical protein [Alphaproteobacteria bacterium]